MSAAPLIALINDDEDLLGMLQDAFALEGYRTVTGLIGRDALRMIRETHPALVVLDLWLERHESGLETLRALRADATTAALPVIVCTAAASYVKQVGQEIEALGATILPKPFDLETLLAYVRASTA